MDFLTGKIVCFHVAQQTMKSSIFSFCTGTHQVFVLIKSVIWPFIDFPGGEQAPEKQQHLLKTRRRRREPGEIINVIFKTSN